MKDIKRIIYSVFIILVITTTVEAHGGNITGWKDKNSDKIIEKDGKFYGYHKQEGKVHYHEIKWNDDKQRWDINKTAVYYDENLNKLSNEQNSEKLEVTFYEKVDGDTAKFILNDDVITVRFLGIDTPETVHPNKAEEPFGKEASDFTEETLKNANKIEIEYDEKVSKTDKYERHLAWIWVDDNLLQEQLIKEGLAKTYMLQDSYKYAGELQEAEEIAREKRLNIWSEEETEIKKDDITQEEQENNDLYKIMEIVILVIIVGIGIVIKKIK